MQDEEQSFVMTKTELKRLNGSETDESENSDQMLITGADNPSH